MEINEILFKGIFIDYKEFFRQNGRSKAVVDELASKIEEITGQHMIEVPEEERKPSFDRTSITEDSIAHIIDAFVHFRNGSTLDADGLSGIMITLNELVNIAPPGTPGLPSFEVPVPYERPLAPSVVYTQANPPGIVYDAMMDAVRRNLYGEKREDMTGYPR